MSKSTAPMQRRWRFPVFLVVGTSLLIGSFIIAALALPSRAADDAPPGTGAAVDITGRKTVVAGTVDTRSGVMTVLPLQPGRVKKVLVQDNQEVDEGATLYLMDDTHARFERDKADIAYQAALQQIEKAKKLPALHRAAIAGQQAVIAAKQAKRDAAQKEADDAKRLADKNLASAQKAAAAQKIVEAADREVDAEQEKLRAIEEEDPQIAVKLAEHDLDAKKKQLEEATWALGECTVKAPFKGKALRVLVNAGDALPNPHQAPVMFCSTGPRIVRAEIEQEFAPKVYIGQPARIKDYTGDDLGTWTGRVESISDWYTHRRSMLLEPLQFNDVRTLEAIIELDPGQAPLKIGQRVRVVLPVKS
jgi:multidrug resistance efflux pump